MKTVERRKQLSLACLARERAALAAEERRQAKHLAKVRAARARAMEIMGAERLTIPDVLTAFGLLARADELLEGLVRRHVKLLRAIDRDAARTEAAIRSTGRSPRGL